MILQTIYEPHGKVQGISGTPISTQLIYQSGKLFNILSYTTSLMDLKQLTKQQFMMILTKSSQNHPSKGFPTTTLYLGLNRVIPTRSSTSKMHTRHTDPNTRFHLIQAKVI